MLSLQPTLHPSRQVGFPAFDWLDDIPVDDWTNHFHSQHSIQLTLGELAKRSGMRCSEGAVEAFRAWAFARKGRRYAILWSGDREPEDTVMIVLLGDGCLRRRKPAKDPVAEGWMW